MTQRIEIARRLLALAKRDMTSFRALATHPETYEFTQDTTVYYGKVKDGTGYQILIPKDVSPADVLRPTGTDRLLK